MHTLNVLRRTEGSPDAHGNPVVVWSSPAPWIVRAVAPGASVDANQPNRDASLIEWTVYADSSDSLPAARDRVVVDGADFEVASTPADWTRGPWPHPTAGVVVELKRWED